MSNQKSRLSIDGKLGVLFIFSVQFIFCLGVISFPEHASAQVAATSSPIIQQLIKDTVVTSRAQSLSCAQLRGSVISSITLSGGGFASVPQTVVLSKDGSTPGISTHSSDSLIVGSNVEKDVTFIFSSPIDVDSTICPDGAVSANVTLSSGYGATPYLFGSTNSDSYTGGEMIGAVGDLYFIINGVAQVNHAPVITSSDSVVGNVGNQIRYKITGYDQDQRKQKFTVSASPLPLGAVLSGDTIYWVPSSDQVGVHDVYVTIVDDGNAGMFARISVTKKVSIVVNSI